MKVVQITTDNRAQLKDYGKATPYFGTAPEGLLQGFALLPEEVEVHVVSVSRVAMETPRMLAPNIFFHQPLVASWGMGRSLFAGSTWAIRKTISALQPDIVHGQGTERDCALGAVFSGYPNVLTLHGNMRVHAKRGENQGRPYYRMAALLESLALRLTDGVVSISTYTDRLVKPLVPRTWLLPNAADLRYFEAKPRSRVPRTILFVGGLDERKNPVSFIKTCGDLVSGNNWRLRLCGTGDPNSEYVRELNDLAARHSWIELAGWKSREELLIEIEEASVLVLPTLEDNCPMVVLEAMAAGLPVMASRVGGIPDLIDEGRTGLMFDPLDPQSMRTSTRRMLEHEELREEIAAAARREAFARFHPRVIARSHLDIYRQVLDSKGKPDGTIEPRSH